MISSAMMLIGKRIYSKVERGVLRSKSLMSEVEKVALGMEIVLLRRVLIVWRSTVGVLLSPKYSIRSTQRVSAFVGRIVATI